MAETPEEQVERIVAQRAGKPKRAQAKKPAGVVPSAASNKQLGGCTGKGFMPGQSGNPNGRPSLAAALEQVLAEDDEITGKPNTYAIAKSIVRVAKAGSVQAFSVIADRIDGKALERIEVTGADGGPIQHADTTPDKLQAYALEAVALVSEAERIATQGSHAPSEVAADGTR